MQTLSNILDQIHDTLPPSVWDDPGSDKPHLKPQHRKWIEAKVHQVLKEGGYTNVDEWLSLVLTGSLTTYQYGRESDCDVSLFVDSEVFPEWSRAEMIGLMVSKVDGTMLPGTTFPMQCFVVPPNIKRENLYKPGLRSGYDLKTDSWVEPPDRGRVHNVEQEENASYVYALESADKMERLLKYEPDKAVMFWHQIHKRRRRDQVAGKGDFAESNIVYKFLANRGLFPALSEASGEYIAKTAAPRQQKIVTKFIYDPVVNHLVLGNTGREEGEHESHYDLINATGMDRKNAVFGQFDQNGRVQTFGRPKIRGFGKPDINQYEADYRLKKAIEATVPGTKFDTFDQGFETEPPQVTYMGEPPKVAPNEFDQAPQEEGVWTF